MSENGRQIVAFIVRITLGICFTYHGAGKVGDMFSSGGLDGLISVLASAGVPLPALTAYLVAAGELFAGVTMLVGFFVNVSATIIIALMAGAIVFVHGRNGYALKDGGFEYNVALISLALASMALGPGILAYKIQLKKEPPKRPQ